MYNRYIMMKKQKLIKMSNIKKFIEFTPESSIEKERLAMERDLNSKMKLREFSTSNTDIPLDSIMLHVNYEIENNYKHQISVGLETGDNIEYLSKLVGKLVIFKPEGDSDVGYYLINGLGFEEDGAKIREYYHLLTQKMIKE